MTFHTDWEPAALGLGGNEGDVLTAFTTALGRLDADPHLRVRAVSSAWKTAPWGLLDQPDFLNAVALVDTRHDAAGLLELLQREEDHAGRERSVRWGPRTLDLDILWYGRERIRTARLEVPHPLLAERSFVIEPALEVAPEWRHPATGESLWDMRARLADSPRWTRCEKAGAAACRS